MLGSKARGEGGAGGQLGCGVPALHHTCPLQESQCDLLVLGAGEASRNLLYISTVGRERSRKTIPTVSVARQSQTETVEERQGDGARNK